MGLFKGWKQFGRTFLACFLTLMLVSGVFADAKSLDTKDIDDGGAYNLINDQYQNERITISNGSLAIKSSAGLPSVVIGASLSGATLVTEESVPIQGDFASVTGRVTLKGPTNISGGSPQVTGDKQELKILGGTAQLMTGSGGADGQFTKVDMQGGTVAVSGNNIIDILSLNNFNLTIRAGITLKANDKTVTPVKETVFTAWGTLPASADGYSLLKGVWTLDGDAKVLSLGSNLELDTTVSVPAGKTLTVGDAASTDTAMRFSASGSGAGNLVANPNVTVTMYPGTTDSLTMGSLTVNGGTVKIPKDTTLTASKVILNSGTLTLGTNSTLIDTDSGRVIKNTGSGELSLSAWGTVTENANSVELGGVWILPKDVKASVTSNSATSATVEGQGGELTVSGDGVYARGYFKSITTTKPLNVKGNDTVCTEEPLLSVSPAADAQFTAWGVLPGIAGTTGYPQYNSLTGAWKVSGNIGVQSTGYDCDGEHAHTSPPVLTSDSDAARIVYVSGASVETGDEHVQIQTLEDAHITGVGDTEVTAQGKTYLQGTFKSVTGPGEIILEGKTVIENAITNTGGESAVSITISGNRQELTVNSGNFQVKGEFSSLTTAKSVFATLCGDVTIQGGNFAIDDKNASQRVVTITGGSGKIEGSFKKLNVQETAKVEDSGELSLTNKDDSCLNITGGEVTLTHKPKITLTGAQTATNAVSVANGKLKIWNGEVSATGVDSKAVYVGADGKFDMGNEDKAYIAETYKYGENGEEMPKLRTNGKNSMGVNVAQGGEAWLRVGEIVLEGEGSRGIDASGTVHIYTNDQYGENPVKSTLLYVHGGHLVKAALWIESGGSFDIRGRGAVLEEPPHDSHEEYYAVYIHRDANLPATNNLSESGFPLSGGTFRGKVYYDQHDLSPLFAPNHYLRYDEDKIRFEATDGTYGVLPYEKDETLPEYYGSYQNIHGTQPPDSTTTQEKFYQFGNQSSYYSVVDAEWELRERMRNAASDESPDGGTYQIPAGIVQNNGNLILDTNVFHIDSGSPASSVWGMGRKQGDVEIVGAGHTLYFAGRTVSYSGKNRNDALLSGLYADVANYVDGKTGFDHPDTDSPAIPYRDDLHALYVKPEGELTLRDCVFVQKSGADESSEGSADEGSTDEIGVNKDTPPIEGGYIGTGTVAYENDVETADCRAIYNGGTLRVISAQVESVKTGVYTVKDSATEIGQTKDETNTLLGENNSNLLIDIVGKIISLSMEGGEATVYGGAVGEIENVLSDAGSATGIEIRDGVLTLYGGIVAGNCANGVGLHTTGGETTIRGGCLYGLYAPDEPAAIRQSLKIDGGEVILNVDPEHGISSEKDGEGYIKAAPENLMTDSVHHIENVEITDGTLYVGADSDNDTTNKRECTRINGTLTCTGGRTNFYRGVVMGQTTVKGADSGADFTTEFFVDKGHFSGLSVEGTQAYEYFGTDINQTSTKLHDRVQIHGGTYRSISVEGLTALSDVTVQNILGHWDNSMDLDEDDKQEWTRYNHYAERNVSAKRNDSGYYYEVASAKVDDPKRAPDEKTLGAADSEATAIVVRDALAEFRAWITANAETESAYALAVNLRLAKICASRFYCSENTDGSYEIGSGVHRLDMNNWGIFGSQQGPLMRYADTDSSGNHLIVTNRAEPSVRHPDTGEEIERLMRNLYTLTDSQKAVGVAVMGGKFTLQADDDIEKGGTVKIRATGTAVTIQRSAGIFIMNAGHLEGDVNGVDNAGSATIQTHNSAIAIKGRSDNGIVNAGKLTITGSKEQTVNITGGTTALQNNDGGWAVAQYANMNGGRIGVENTSATLNDANSETVYLESVTVKAGIGNGEEPDKIGVSMSAGALYAKDSEITGQHIGIQNSSAGQNKNGQTVLLSGTKVTGTVKAGIDNSNGALFVTEKSAINGGAKGILNSGGTISVDGSKVTGETGISNSSVSLNSDGVTVTLTNSDVTGTKEAGVLSSAGMLEMSATVVTGDVGKNGVKMTDASNAKIHEATQINADKNVTPPSEDVAALYAETTGTVDIDGGSFSRGAGLGVEHTSGEFLVTGGNLGDYALKGGALTVKNGEGDAKANFASVTQSGGTAALYGGAFMGTYTHTAGKVTVSVVPEGEAAVSATAPTFTWFKGVDASGGENVILNAGRFLENIENTSGKALDLLGSGAIVVCDGSDAVETHDYDESKVIESYILGAYQKLETTTYKNQEGNNINLSAPFSITRPDISKIEVDTEKVTSSYIVGQTMNFDVKALTLYYHDGTTKSISLASPDVKITDEDGVVYKNGAQTPKTPGVKKLTVSYMERKFGQETGEDFSLTVVNRKMKSIALETPPTLLEYLTTDTKIDRAGGKIRVTYDFGTYEKPDETSKILDLDASGVSISQYEDKASDAEFDNTSIGQRKIWIRYEEAYQAYEGAAQETTAAATPLTITVMSSEVSSITITKRPDKTSYVEYEAEKLDMTGCELTLTYRNGTVKEKVTFASDANLSVEGFDTARVGEYDVYAVYQEEGATAKRAPFKIKVLPRTLKGLKTGNFPATSEYTEGKVTLDLSGGTLTASYDYAPDATIAMAANQVVNNLDAVNPGTLAIVFRYTENGKTLTTEGEEKPFSITVKAKELTEIVLESGPVKTAYDYGEALNPAGGKVWLKYNNDTSELISLSADMLSGFDPWKTGTQSLAVTYEGKTASDKVSVTVGTKTLESVRLDIPKEVTVLEGQELDISSWKLIPVYNADPDGNREGEPVAIQKAWISGYDKDTAKPGNVTLTVSYTENARTCAAECSITVTAKSFASAQLTPPAKRSYYEGDILNPDGGSLSVTYDNGYKETVSLTDTRITLGGFDSSASAFEGIAPAEYDDYGAPAVKQKVSLTFNGNPCGDFEVTVVKKRVVMISIVKQPDKLEYGEGEELNLSGGQLNLTYNNRATEDGAPMTDARFHVSGYRGDLPGEQELTVTCEDSDASCVFNVNVKAAYELSVSSMNYFIRVNAKNPLTRAYLILSCYDPETDQFMGKWMKLLDLSEGNQGAALETPQGAENSNMELMLVDRLGISVCDAVFIPAP